MNKPVYAIKFKNFCQNNNYTAKDIANILDMQTTTVYKYFSGKIAVPDTAKKILEQKVGLPIYEIFFNESFDNEITTVKKSYLDLLEQQIK